MLLVFLLQLLLILLLLLRLLLSGLLVLLLLHYQQHFAQKLFPLHPYFSFQVTNVTRHSATNYTGDDIHMRLELFDPEGNLRQVEKVNVTWEHKRVITVQRGKTGCVERGN